MNKYLIKETIDALEKLNIVYRNKYTPVRIEEEERSLNRLLKKNTFLSSYDEAVRYMFILLLRHGYDIKKSKVHYSLRIFLNTYLGVDEINISKLVSARHAMKYHGDMPAKSTIILICSICADLYGRYNNGKEPLRKSA